MVYAYGPADACGGSVRLSADRGFGVRLCRRGRCPEDRRRDGFLLKSLEIVDAYNDLMSGRDPNYPDADELLKIRVDRYGQSYFSSFISVKKSTNQFAVFFNLADELIQDENDDTVPDLILIFTKGRKEWVEKDDSVQMLPDLLAAFA